MKRKCLFSLRILFFCSGRLPAVVLACFVLPRFDINNLENDGSISSCATNYEHLIPSDRFTFNSLKAIVLSVMPVRKSSLDRTCHRKIAGIVAKAD